MVLVGCGGDALLHQPLDQGGLGRPGPGNANPFVHECSLVLCGPHLTGATGA
ncbi:hypothetical protein D3C77_735640 [compost metagenome]